MQVGELAGGVAAAEWSPDGELLSLVSGRGQLLLMNKVLTGGEATNAWPAQARTHQGVLSCHPGVGGDRGDMALCNDRAPRPSSPGHG
jgi:hypothetical protein